MANGHFAVGINIGASLGTMFGRSFNRSILGSNDWATLSRKRSSATRLRGRSSGYRGNCRSCGGANDRLATALESLSYGDARNVLVSMVHDDVSIFRVGDGNMVADQHGVVWKQASLLDVGELLQNAERGSGRTIRDRTPPPVPSAIVFQPETTVETLRESRPRQAP